MTERELEHIITAYDEGSFLAAAKKLFISQSALSQSIRKLERQLGTKLFTLDGNRIRPTKDCKSIVTLGRPVSLKWAAFQSDVERLLTADQLGLRVIASGDLLVSVILPSTDRFRLTYPEVNVSLSEMSTVTLYEHLENDTEDMGFIQRVEPSPKYQMTPVLSTRYCLAVPASHPFARMHPFRGVHDMETVDLASFRDEMFAIPRSGHNSRGSFLDIFREAGFFPNIAFEAATIPNMREYVFAGKALTLVTSYYVSTHMQEKRAAYYRLNLRSTERTIYAVRSLNARPSAIVDAFIKEVAACQADIL